MEDNRKTRRTALNLTDEEVKDLGYLAIRGGVTAETLLEDFVADLTGSEYSGGSDERQIARAWYDRRGYEYLAVESEPTDEDRKAASFATVGTLERLEDETYKAYGVDHKPAGLKWVIMALDLAERITNEPGLLDAITEADLDQLTAENFHTARHAAEVAQYLKKYTI